MYLSVCVLVNSLFLFCVHVCLICTNGAVLYSTFWFLVFLTQCCVEIFHVAVLSSARSLITAPSSSRVGMCPCYLSTLPGLTQGLLPTPSITNTMAVNGLGHVLLWICVIISLGYKSKSPNVCLLGCVSPSFHPLMPACLPS